MDLGFSFNHSKRSSMMTGSEDAPNPERNRTNSSIYTFDSAAGIWRSLSVRLQLPLLDTEYHSTEDSGSDLELGDMNLALKYQFSIGDATAPFRIGIGAGVYFPTGGGSNTGIPSNPNFVSGTFDPTVFLDASYDFKFGLGFYAQVFSRIVAYENDDGFRAGSSVVYGGGVRYRIIRLLIPSLGVTALYSAENKTPVPSDEGTGGDLLYLTPGLSVLADRGPLEGAAYFTLIQIPVYQNLNGTQLAEDINFMVGVAYSFSLLGEDDNHDDDESNEHDNHDHHEDDHSHDH